jgi:hypothetical protein
LPPPAGAVVKVASAEELYRACQGAAEGSTILLAAGTYHLPDLLRLRGLKKVTVRGEAGGRDQVVLDGSRSRHRELVWFEECDGVTVADLTLQNAPVHGFTVKGESNAQRVRIYNCRLRNCWERAIKGTAPYGKDGKMATSPDEEVLKVRPAGGRIEYCWIENDHRKLETDWTGGDYVGGIDMMWLKDWVISDNVFIGIQGRNAQGRAAIFVWNNSEDVVVERNLVVACDTGIAVGNPSGAARHMTRGTLRNNFIVNGSYKAVELARTADCKVYNNTVWSEDASWERTFHVFQGAEGVEVFNNLVRGQLRLDGPGAKARNNLAGALEGFFVNPRQGNLHLSAAGAGAVAGKGLALSPDPGDFDGQGRAGGVDLGADQAESARGGGPPR